MSAAKKRGPGRPRLRNAASEQVTAKLAATERKACLAAAKRAGLTLSAWARETLLAAVRGPR